MSGLGDARSIDPIQVALDDDVATDPTKDALRIELPDGSITINLGPVRRASENGGGFSANLAEDMPDDDLATVADELIQGIEEDERSRSDWLEERADGIKLLALKVEKPDASEEGAGRSKSRDTLLLEAVLRFQANASGELMPVDGPVKIRDDNQAGSGTDRSALADDLETDLNHYLTSIATEYYPDTDRMLFWTGFGGSGFKKVYRCPVRCRPVSEAVDAADIIVSNAATDLANADRVTHVVKMPKATMKRMQILKAYRDVGLLGSSGGDLPNAVDRAKENLSGVKPSQRPQDEPFTLYECYCQIDLPGYEHEEDGEPTGLPLPYKVVIEKTSREVLEIRRNWLEDDDMRMPRKRFVKFPFVPGLGFYDIGLLHIAGNPTVTATALLRIMVDAGIFGNFPGFLHAKSAGRTQTNVINVMPGTSVPVDTNGLDDIRKSILPLPYKTPDSATLELANAIRENGAKVAGTAELQVGEGRQDTPVGTMIAIIEQATKVLDAVHKRLHRAQGEEFALLRDLFKETPEDFWRLNKSPSRAWDEQTFLDALEDCDFVPVADPNTSSHVQRIMKAQAVYQMAQQDPVSFDKPSVYKLIGDTIRVSNFESLLAKGPPPAPSAPPPTVADLAKMKSADADMIEAQTKASASKSQDAIDAADAQNRAADRQSKEKIASLDLAKEQLAVEGKLKAQAFQAGHDQQHEAMRQQADHAHDVRMAGLGAALKPQTPPAGNA